MTNETTMKPFTLWLLPFLALVPCVALSQAKSARPVHLLGSGALICESQAAIANLSVGEEGPLKRFLRLKAEAEIEKAREADELSSIGRIEYINTISRLQTPPQSRNDPGFLEIQRQGEQLIADSRRRQSDSAQRRLELERQIQGCAQSKSDSQVTILRQLPISSLTEVSIASGDMSGTVVWTHSPSLQATALPAQASNSAPALPSTSRLAPNKTNKSATAPK